MSGRVSDGITIHLSCCHPSRMSELGIGTGSQCEHYQGSKWRLIKVVCGHGCCRFQDPFEIVFQPCQDEMMDDG